jgi:hypothetical protein
MNDKTKPIAEGEIILPGQWQPSGPPITLLPPDQEPDLNFDEVIGNLDAFSRLYYEQSGRYLGRFQNQEVADRADPYRWARQYCPEGVLPWEVR